MEEIDLDQIATLLSDLSQPGEIPKLTPSVSAPIAFNPDEVGFEASEWLARVVEVSFWLNLDSNLTLETCPQAVARQLFSEIAPDVSSECFESSGSVVSLTTTGVDALSERLGRAVGYREAFLEAVHEERPLSEATAEWIDLWNEVVPTEPLSINATVGTLNINDLEGWARRGLLDLNPTYQRDYVWPDGQSQMLIESVLRGIPLPSIILAKESNSKKIQVVDGKQRITAILRFMAAHPEGRENAQALKDPELIDSNFGKFARRNQLRATDIRKMYLPFKTKKFSRENDPLKPLGGKYYCDIRDEPINIAGEEITVADLFERTTEYKLPVLTYKDTNVSDIHTVFQLYNKQGMKLNAEEIRNAAFNHLIISRMMLFISGDRSEHEIVSELNLSGLDVDSTHENIDALGFSVSRFRRTKVLFWALSTLFLAPKQKQEGGYHTPSTASHIDEFLRSVDDGRLKQFRDEETLQKLAADLVAALELLQTHGAAWHEKFRSKKGLASKWEELPVIATMIVCLVLVSLKSEQKLEEAEELVREATSRLEGPESTQNKTQWAHIANSSITILEVLSIDLSEAREALTERYGSCALDALFDIKDMPLV